jgi:hypothetical protein
LSVPPPPAKCPHASDIIPNNGFPILLHDDDFRQAIVAFPSFRKSDYPSPLSEDDNFSQLLNLAHLRNDGFDSPPQESDEETAFLATGLQTDGRESSGAEADEDPGDYGSVYEPSPSPSSRDRGRNVALQREVEVGDPLEEFGFPESLDRLGKI